MILLVYSHMCNCSFQVMHTKSWMRIQRNVLTHLRYDGHSLKPLKRQNVDKKMLGICLWFIFVRVQLFYCTKWAVIALYNSCEQSHNRKIISTSVQDEIKFCGVRRIIAINLADTTTESVTTEMTCLEICVPLFWSSHFIIITERFYFSFI